MKNTNYLPSISTVTQDYQLPYCLTHTYQLRIKKIDDLISGRSTPDQTFKRGEGKNTGIWCPKECED